MLTHAQHTFRTTYCYKSSISPLTITMNLPTLLLFRSDNTSLLKAQKSLRKRMVYIYIDNFILIIHFFLGKLASTLLISPNELPDIIFRNMIRVERAARDFIKMPTLWYFYFMRVQIVFCFQITKDNRLRQIMSLSVRTKLMQRLKKNLQFLITHVDNTAHEY